MPTLPRRALLLVAGAATLATPLLAEAQFLKRDQYGRVPRRHVLPFVGMLITGSAASVILQAEQRSMKGACTSAGCIAGVSLGLGAWVGWMVGREKDQLHELRYRGGRPLTAPTSSLPIAGEPVALTTANEFIATAGLGGVHVLRNTSDRFEVAGVRAAGLRGINDVAIAPRDAQLGIVAGGGFYKFPLLDGQGVQLRAGGSASAVSTWDDAFLVATGSRLERVPRSADDPVASWPGVEIGDTVRAISVSGRVAWAVTSSELLALERAGDSARVVSRLRLPRGARRLTVRNTTIAVALGDSGVVVVDGSSPASPSITKRWSGTRFAYDVALTNDRLFVATGIDGVSVLSTTGPELTAVGLARDLGFVVNVAIQGDQLIAIDRSGTPVVRKVRATIGQ